jgi:hypothetical protein
VIKLFLPFLTVAAVTLCGRRRDFCDRAGLAQYMFAQTVMCTRASRRESLPLPPGAFPFREKPRLKRATASASASVWASVLVGWFNLGLARACGLHRSRRVANTNRGGDGMGLNRVRITVGQCAHVCSVPDGATQVVSSGLRCPACDGVGEFPECHAVEWGSCSHCRYGQERNWRG